MEREVFLLFIKRNNNFTNAGIPFIICFKASFVEVFKGYAGRDLKFIIQIITNTLFLKVFIIFKNVKYEY